MSCLKPTDVCGNNCYCFKSLTGGGGRGGQHFIGTKENIDRKSKRGLTLNKDRKPVLPVYSTSMMYWLQA